MKDIDLEKILRRLFLPGIVKNLELRLREAEENHLGYTEFLTHIFQDELENRSINSYKKYLKAANFGEQKTLEGFDFQFNKEEISPSLIRDLATCRFTDKKENVVIVGPSGIGKSHICKALGHEAVRRKYSTIYSKFNSLLMELQEAEIHENIFDKWKKYTRPALLILDDFALRKLTFKEAELFYHLIDERLGNGALIITSSRDIQDWLGMFPDPVIADSIMDRVVSNAHKIIATKAKSYRKEGTKYKKTLPSEE